MCDLVGEDLREAIVGVEAGEDDLIVDAVGDLGDLLEDELDDEAVLLGGKLLLREREGEGGGQQVGELVVLGEHIVAELARQLVIAPLALPLRQLVELRDDRVDRLVPHLLRCPGEQFDGGGDEVEPIAPGRAARPLVAVQLAHEVLERLDVGGRDVAEEVKENLLLGLRQPDARRGG